MAAKTVFTYPLTGGRDFPIPFEYLARKFIQVTLKGGAGTKSLLLNTDYRFSSKTQITTIQSWSPDANYDVLEIRRYTSATERLVDFNDGSILRSYDLNLSQIQTLHVAEEARDLTADTIGVNGDGDLDARNRKIVNVSYGTNALDAVNKSQLDGAIGVSSDLVTQAQAARDAAEGFKNQAGSFASNSESSAQASYNHSLNALASEQGAAASAGTALAAKDGSELARDKSEGWANTSKGHSDTSLQWADQSALHANTSTVYASESNRHAAISEQHSFNARDWGAAEVGKAAAEVVKAAAEVDKAKVEVVRAAGEADRSKTEADRAKAEADRAAALEIGAMNDRIAVTEQKLYNVTNPAGSGITINHGSSPYIELHNQSGHARLGYLKSDGTYIWGESQGSGVIVREMQTIDSAGTLRHKGAIWGQAITGQHDGNHYGLHLGGGTEYSEIVLIAPNTGNYEWDGGLRTGDGRSWTVGGSIGSRQAGYTFSAIGGQLVSYSDECMELRGNTYSFVTSSSDAHVCYNAYFDGGTWRKFNDQNNSYSIMLRHDGLVLNHSIAGSANPNDNSYKVYHQGFKPTAKDVGAHEVKPWIASPAMDANATGNYTAFTYANNAPEVGILTSFGVDGYTMQFNAAYQGERHFRFRTHNQDAGLWNPWMSILTSENPPTAVEVGALPLTGGNLSGSINAKGVYSSNADGSAEGKLEFNGDVHGSIWGNGWLSNWILANLTSPLNALAAKLTSVTSVSEGIQVSGVGAPRIELHRAGARAYLNYIDDRNNNLSWARSNGAGQPQGSIFFHFDTADNMGLTGGIWAAGGFHDTSDIRLKKDIEQVGGLEAVEQLRGVKWSWDVRETDVSLGGVKSAGIIAQEVQKVLPEVVSIKDDLLSVNYAGVTALLINAVNELSAKVKELEAKLK